MVAYFRFQHNIILLLGAAAGLLTALSGAVIDVNSQPGYLRMFLYAMFLFVGVIIARIVSAYLANRKLRKLNQILYVDGDPERYIRLMQPLVEKVPQNTIEYVDGCNKLAFAYEAGKEYKKALDMIHNLKPEQLKLHALTGSAATLNQRLRLRLLMGDREGARSDLDIMRELCGTARSRAPVLASNLEHCIQLYSIWLNHLMGITQEADYVKEEMELATNPIYKAEMRELFLSMTAS